LLILLVEITAKSDVLPYVAVLPDPRLLSYYQAAYVRYIKSRSNLGIRAYPTVAQVVHHSLGHCREKPAAMFSQPEANSIQHNSPEARAANGLDTESQQITPLGCVPTIVRCEIIQHPEVPCS
jgi:hypothetical protein